MPRHHTLLSHTIRLFSQLQAASFIEVRNVHLYKASNPVQVEWKISLILLVLYL